MSEVQDMTQILMLTGRGAFKLGEVSVKAVQFFMQLCHSVHTKSMERHPGEVNYDKLITAKGGEVQVVDINTQDVKELAKVKKELKERKITFSQLPDFDLHDGYTQFMIHVSDASKMNAYYRAHPGFARQSSMDEYYNKAPNDVKEEVRKEAAEAVKKGDNKEKEVEEPEPSHKTSKAAAEDLKHDNAYKTMSTKETAHEITIDKSLITAQTENSVISRVPGTKAQNYIITPKNHMFDLVGSKSMAIVIDKEHKYDVCDKQGKVIGKMKGESLIKHYDGLTQNLMKKRKRQLEKGISVPVAHAIRTL